MSNNFVQKNEQIFGAPFTLMIDTCQLVMIRIMGLSCFFSLCSLLTLLPWYSHCWRYNTPSSQASWRWSTVPLLKIWCQHIFPQKLLTLIVANSHIFPRLPFLLTYCTSQIPPILPRTTYLNPFNKVSKLCLNIKMILITVKCHFMSRFQCTSWLPTHLLPFINLMWFRTMSFDA